MGFSLDLIAPGTNKNDVDDREEGEIVEVNEYEDISSDEEFNLRQRIEELEARNLELEKIASISSAKASEYDLGYGNPSCIDLVEDELSDDYSHGHHRRVSNKKCDRTRRRKEKAKDSNCKHERKKQKSKRHSSHSMQRASAKVRCKARRNNSVRARQQDYSSSEENYVPDRNELQAALKRDVPESTQHRTSLRSKLQGVQESVTDFIESKAKEDDEQADLSASIEILELLDTLTDEHIIHNEEVGVIRISDDSEDESVSLEEQELRLIALKSAILKKHETRKKRKLNEERPYSPTDMDIILDNTASAKIDMKYRNEPENMEISPAVSPTLPDKTLLPVDMELSSDCSKSPLSFMDCGTNHFDINTWNIIPLPPDKVSNDITNFEIFQQQTLPHNHPLPPPPPPPVLPPDVSSTDSIPQSASPKVNQLETDTNEHSIENSQLNDEEEIALRALLLAKLNSPKARKRKVDVAPADAPKSVMPVAIDLRSADSMADTSLDAEQLRMLLLISINKKDEQKENLAVSSSIKKSNNIKDTVQRLKAITTTTTPPISKPKITVKQPCDINNSNLININLNAFNEKNKTQIPAVTTKLDTFVPTGTTAAVATNKSHFPSAITPTHKSTAICVSADSKTVSTIVDNKIKTTDKLETKPICPIDVEKTRNATISHKNGIALGKSAATIKRKAIGTDTNVDSGGKKMKLQRSKAITDLNPKIVKKMVIQLENSDSESIASDYDYGGDYGTEATEADRFFDNASPASIAMDSPRHSPSSPMFISTASNDTSDPIDSSAPVAAKAKPPIAVPLAFERKLDEFLKSVWTKEEQAKLTVSTKKVASPAIARSSRTPKTPLVVKHLPLSSQIEYRRLTDRMRLLERQKQSKLDSKAAAKEIIGRPVTDISVTIVNNQKSVAPKTSTKLPTVNKKLSPSCSAAVGTKSQSLVKKVLVKNVSQQARAQRKTESFVTGTAMITTPPQTNASVIKEPDAESINTVHIDTVKVENIIKQSESKPAAATSAAEIALSTVPSSKLNTVQKNQEHDFKTMSQNDKDELLKESEENYNRHSTQFLSDLKDMHTLVCSAQLTKTNQFKLEDQLDQLKLQMAAIEQAMTAETTKIAKLYPAISASHQKILLSRSKCLGLSAQCQVLGKDLKGPEYKIPADVRDVMIDKLKEISSETKKLKNMKKENYINCKDDKESEVGSSSEAHTDIGDGSVERVAAVHAEVTPENTDMPASVPTVPEENVSHNVKKYQSPLDHMQNSSAANPDGVLCPFQLMGQCEDKDCAYQHLSS